MYVLSNMVNPKKCQFHVQKAEFFGHIITPGEIRMDPKKIEAINNWEPATDVKKVQSFLGLANYVLPKVYTKLR